MSVLCFVLFRGRKHFLCLFSWEDGFRKSGLSLQTLFICPPVYSVWLWRHLLMHDTQRGEVRWQQFQTCGSQPPACPQPTSIYLSIYLSVPPKRRLTQDMHGVTSQKTAFLIFSVYPPQIKYDPWDWSRASEICDVILCKCIEDVELPSYHAT
jgi:hypothetical protein